MSSKQDILHALLHDIANKQNFDSYELEVTPIITGGANYSSLLYVAKIFNDRKELHLFIKKCVLGKKLREEIQMPLYETEIKVYTKLKPAYRALEDKHRIPEEHRLHFPEYYGSNLTIHEEMLVLENLTVKGFVTHDRLKPIDWGYASKAVVELGKLHALSMAYQIENPEQFQRFAINSVDWLNERTMDVFLNVGFQTVLPLVRDENREAMRNFLDKTDVEMAKKMLAPCRCKVFTHRDYKPSNLMHRTKEDGSLEVIVVDYQMTRVGCPVTDLLLLIIIGTDKEFRDKYFDKLMDHYYTHLSDAMRRLAIDPEIMYSRADFNFEVKEKLPYGLIVAMFSLPLTTVEAEHAPELSADMDLSIFTTLKIGKSFTQRMNDIVDDYIRWGVLKKL